MPGTATLSISVGSVTSEACRRWLLSGQVAESLPWDHFMRRFDIDDGSSQGICEVVVASDAEAVDCFVEKDPAWAQVRWGAEMLVGCGWAVTILAPLAEVGAAHQALRGSGVRIQGWWQKDDNLARFTPHESA